MSDALPGDLDAGLALTRDRRGALGSPVYYFTETGSTNEVAGTLAEQGAADGTLVVASSQTAGRGRLGRSWHSPPDAGLYVSLVIRRPAVAPFLTLAGGVAVAEGIRRSTGLPVQIKWPNDIIVAGGAPSTRRRKLAGILAEASSGPEGVVYVVLGFGINVAAAAYPPELADRATSLEAELDRRVERGMVLGESLACLEGELSSLEAAGPAALLEHWRRLSPLSRSGSVEFDTPSGRATGVAAGIDDGGALLVRVDQRVERVVAGEVVWK